MLGLTRRTLLTPGAVAHRLVRPPSGTSRGIKSLLPHVQAQLNDTSIPEKYRVKTEALEFTVSFEDVERAKKNKLRLDQYLANQIPDVSRAQLQHGIAGSLVMVNHRIQLSKHMCVHPGDIVTCTLPPPPITSAIPQDIPIDIVYEDKHLLVINKAAGMVVHPAPGNRTGTLVNAVLHHCGLPAIECGPGQELPAALNDWPELSPPTGDEILDEEEVFVPPPLQQPPASNGQPPLLRPGVVHRLDKGTTGLMVMAKDAYTQWQLSNQFKEHSVERLYLSIVLRAPAGPRGIIESKIGRDTKDRKRMMALPTHANRGRLSRSTFEVVKPLAGSCAALVQWKLSTGRTHQIRVHAQHIGHPLLGDETYGGTGGGALHILGKNNKDRILKARALLAALGRPALHAKTLGFTHPATGAVLRFDSELPQDFHQALEDLKDLMHRK